MSLLPALLGKFALYVHSSPTQSLKVVRTRFDPATGNAVAAPLRT